MAIFNRNRISDEPVGSTPNDMRQQLDAITNVRKQLEAISNEQKRALSEGTQPSATQASATQASGTQAFVRPNAVSPSPDQLLSFSFRTSSRPPEPPRVPAAAAPQAAAQAPRIPAQDVSRTEAMPVVVDDGEEPNDLVIRRGVNLKGELSSCERLVIQGHLEASVTECGKLELAEGGTFKGSARVRDADIAGHLDGILRVEGDLVVRATARISGTVHYGHLAVQEGAVLRAKLEDIPSVEGSDRDADQSVPGETTEVAAE